MGEKQWLTDRSIEIVRKWTGHLAKGLPVDRLAAKEQPNVNDVLQHLHAIAEQHEEESRLARQSTRRARAR